MQIADWGDSVVVGSFPSFDKKLLSMIRVSLSQK